jgi:hypothetical protein
MLTRFGPFEKIDTKSDRCRMGRSERSVAVAMRNTEEGGVEDSSYQIVLDVKIKLCTEQLTE